jgi:hypothetical protein
MKTTLVAALAIIAVLAAVLLWRHVDESPASAHAVAGKAIQLPASSVLKINPRQASPVASPTSIAKTPLASIPPEVAQLRTRTGWAALKDRLASAPLTGASLYVQAEIYSRCAKRARAGGPPSRASARERFIASIEGQPDAAQRIAAWEKGNVDSCEGIPTEEYSNEKLDALIAAAAQAGDARAQAWQVARAIEAEYNSRTRPDDARHGLAISPEQEDTIRRTLASRDPGVVREYQGLLASTVSDGTWRLPGIEGRVDERALYGAMALVACDLGANCGAESPDLLSACAQNGYCGASNMYDHIYFYDASPNSAQLMERYREALVQAINSGDLSGLRISREPTNSNRGFLFGGRRGP